MSAEDFSKYEKLVALLRKEEKKNLREQELHEKVRSQERLQKEEASKLEHNLSQQQ